MPESERWQILAAFEESLVHDPHLLTIDGSGTARLPAGFVCDAARFEIGLGTQTFAAARDAMQRWQQFDLGWVSITDPSAAIMPGRVVGVEARAAGLWTFNVCRIVAVTDEPSRFGFIYETTDRHVERGAERFIIELDPNTQVVSYCIEAVSRPRHPLVWIAYPFARATQHRFVRDSADRMREAVSSRNTFR
jgi:uncharacterized protein (UPF0548 family)